ncbi:hypothetical protein J5Y09_24090 [Roseomonas sp. PWR1]|uniref:Uncharacterized protein n=1 Tax=Roseomonas nitratireducens TaxID=2820810 RepID=A0ABS4B0A9_9PROT|nr:hypothetical protein [Neoroseomonas nitratireducens]MBP0467025.1 hypothetical protein [Neoroseomonas nitratireducens]
MMNALSSIEPQSSEATSAWDEARPRPTREGIAACLALLEWEARTLGMDLAASLIGAASLEITTRDLATPSN